MPATKIFVGILKWINILYCFEQLNDLSKRLLEKTMKKKEVIVKQEKAKELAKLEIEKYNIFL